MDIASLGEIGRRLRALTTNPTSAVAQGIDESVDGLRSLQRETAMMLAQTMGAKSGNGVSFLGRCNFATAWQERRLILDRIEASDLPYLVIDPRPGLRIVDANDQYATATKTCRRDMRGERMFEVFPDNPDDPGADGVNNLYASICNAAQIGRTHAMMTQRYDVLDASGVFLEKYWMPVNTPIYDDRGHLLYILHHARDVTVEVLKARAVKHSFETRLAPA